MHQNFLSGILVVKCLPHFSQEIQKWLLHMSLFRYSLVVQCLPHFSQEKLWHHLSWKLWDFYFIQLLNLIEKITSTLEFDRKKHFKFFEIFENHRILDFKQLNLIEKITSNFEKFEKFEVLMRTLFWRQKELYQKLSRSWWYHWRPRTSYL